MPLPPPSSFNSSQLVRFLSGLGIAEVPAARLTAAERWSRWLDWTDAIALSAAIHAAPSPRSSTPRPAAATRVRSVTDDFKRMHAELLQAIDQDPLFTGSACADDGPGFSTLRAQYLAHQRAMAARIEPLRVSVRAALTAASSDLARLAALDAVLDQALAVRERQLLATVPGWLEKHFARARPGAAQASASGSTVAGPTLQRALRAELEIRLQPIEGMIEALGEHAPSQP
jgi:Protein of unknown function (DUF3348)